MRLWSLHPKYLDRIGLITLWRESLLAQKVLKGETKGYIPHPQLRRFRAHPEPMEAIGNYLTGIWIESIRRGYRFNREKIETCAVTGKIKVTRGQLYYEYCLLSTKLKNRNMDKYARLPPVKEIECHPLFEIIDGEVEEWEKKKRQIIKTRPQILSL